MKALKPDVENSLHGDGDSAKKQIHEKGRQRIHGYPTGALNQEGLNLTELVNE